MGFYKDKDMDMDMTVQIFQPHTKLLSNSLWNL